MGVGFPGSDDTQIGNLAKAAVGDGGLFGFCGMLIVFALSKIYWLSAASLAGSGFFMIIFFATANTSVQTRVPGLHLGGLFPLMGRMADKMAFVRSFAHGNSGHGGADLIVKGAYTQSRLRQMIFGGMTRHLILNSTLPVLFSY